MPCYFWGCHGDGSPGTFEPGEPSLWLVQRGSSTTTTIWRSPLAWQIAIFLGFQSFLYYVTISWLPEILHSHGISMETAGWLLSFTQLVGLPASFFIPVLAGRAQSQIWIAFMLGMCSIVGYSGLLLGSSYPILIVLP
ncbi:cyanate permease [Neobacillus niacini]|uniref:hypothetical protein n=1 Tax=Neobacillus niacini TaxID=86668 RepID=UPI0028607335|nr:hypothetical protein [Neobacillus niacini]MDR7080112.1 cyanate permease [Neobacillus niacini]